MSKKFKLHDYSEAFQKAEDRELEPYTELMEAYAETESLLNDYIENPMARDAALLNLRQAFLWAIGGEAFPDFFNDDEEEDD